MDITIKSDLYRYLIVKTDLFSLIKALRIPGVAYMYFYRQACKVKKNSFRGICYRLILRHLSFKFGFQIPLGAEIGKGFYIGHFGNIVISPYAIIGENCNIAHGVTIGEISHGRMKGTPKIGNFVWIGTNSIIVGNVRIGTNVLIAPGAFVNFDVPDNSLVIGNPGKIISKSNPVYGYINNIL